MSASSAVRNRVESVLSSTMLGALSPRGKTELVRIPCGILAVDALLGGGMPVGVITELIGEEGCGRTTAALAYMAAITRASGVCAWIDVSDVLDPESVAANGVDLEKLLWIRCGSTGERTVKRPAELRQSNPVAATAPPSEPKSTEPKSTGGGSPHPRAEGRDMPEAIRAMLQAHGGLYDQQVCREKKAIGTPGAPNRPLIAQSENREEQVNSDRLPPRRGENLALAPRSAEPLPRLEANRPSGDRRMMPTSPAGSSVRSGVSPWQALDQALRAADLLLQGGGFSAIVLDLGSVAPEFAWRIPLATWFRFRATCERSRVSLLVLSRHSCARSSAELVVRLEAGCMQAQSKVMTGVRYRAVTERNRSEDGEGRVVPIRKGPQPERPGEWFSAAAWAQAR